MLVIVIALAIILIVIIALLFIPKKCVTYSDTKTGQKGGGCFSIWRKGYWHAYPELFGPNIVETKTFSEISGFSFEYPVFEGWEVKQTENTEQDRYIINYSRAYAVKPPAVGAILYQVIVNVDKISKPGYPAPGSPILFYPPKDAKKNSKGVFYKEYEKNLTFYLDDFAIDVKIESVTALGNGFSSNIFFKTIIDSFKFEEASERSSKIEAPKEALPVSYLNVKYTAPITINKLGYIVAFDKKTGEKIWEKKIYEQKIDPNLEEDVQWVFIMELKIENQQLIITNTNNEVYSMTILGQAIPPIIKRIK